MKYLVKIKSYRSVIRHIMTLKNDYHIYHLYSDKNTFIDIKLYKGFVIFINEISNESNTQEHSP